jgi:hypothetical protein
VLVTRRGCSPMKSCCIDAAAGRAVPKMRGSLATP